MIIEIEVKWFKEFNESQILEKLFKAEQILNKSHLEMRFNIKEPKMKKLTYEVNKKDVVEKLKENLRNKTKK